jgi:aminoglycoside phosphotransferase (APT) family kinase protein
MPSPTVRDLAAAVIYRLVTPALAGQATCTAAEPLAGGSYAAVWRCRLSTGVDVVVKVAPATDVPVLTYESSLVDAEAEYFTLLCEHAPGVPVPRVLHVGHDDEFGDWLVMTHLDGDPLSERAGTNDDFVRRELGAAIARVHRIPYGSFGYSGARPHGATWPDAFRAIVEALLMDAATWAVPLGGLARDIEGLLDRHATALALVTRPHVVHFDLWDGNVLATGDREGRLSGLVDGERWLAGDPLIDFVSPALFRRIEDEADNPFVAGYTEVAANPLLEPGARQRIALYRMFLYLLMAIEAPSRGRGGAGDAEWPKFLHGLLSEEVSGLQQLPVHPLG